MKNIYEMMADDLNAFLDSTHMDSCNVIEWNNGGINVCYWPCTILPKSKSWLSPAPIYGRIQPP